MAGYVFISYSRTERGYVERLAAHLTLAGVAVWYDYHVHAGDPFGKKIQQAIDDCSAFVVVLTPASVASEWVAREISRAVRIGKPIRPLLLQSVQSREFPVELEGVQHEDVTGEPGRMPAERFVAGLRALASPAANGPVSNAAAQPDVAPMVPPTPSINVEGVGGHAAPTVAGRTPGPRPAPPTLPVVRREARPTRKAGRMAVLTITMAGLTVGLVVTATNFLSGIGRQSPVSEPCELKFGFFGALSGDGSGSVIPMHNGSVLAVDQYNTTNPICKATLVGFDTQGSPDNASGLARIAVGEVATVPGGERLSLVAMIGPAFSAESEVANAIFDGYPAQASVFLKQLRFAGWKETFVGGEDINDTSMLSATGTGNVEGTISTCVCAPPNASGAGFQAAYKQRFGMDAGMRADVAYDITNVFLDGVKAGKKTRADLLAFLAAYDKKGSASGVTYQWDANGELGPTEVVVWTFEAKSGAWVPKQRIQSSVAGPMWTTPW